MIRKRKIGYLLLIFLLTIIEGCNTNNHLIPEKQQSLKKIILTKDTWGRVAIDDKVTLNNVDYFVSNLHDSRLKPSELLLEVAIKAQLIYQDGQKEMYFSKDWAYDGKVVYQSKNTSSIYAILKNYIYSSKQLSEIVSNSTAIFLAAKDIQKTCNIVNKGELVQAFAASSQVSGDLEQAQQLPPEYPYYFMNATLPSNKKVEITLISPDFFVVNDLQELRIYSNGQKLWEYCADTLGKPVLQPNQISYLFQANSINASKWEWDLKQKKHHIVRALLESKKLNKKITNLKANYKMIFMVNGQNVPVQIYDNHFEFRGNYYYCPDIKNILERIISAG